jgi:DNA processing protein
LGDILIVTQADINSGTLTSINYALKMGKKVFTLPHRLNESLGTQNLIKQNLINVIYDIDEFIEEITGVKKNSIEDEILLFCKNNPSYEEAMNKFPNKIFEYELEGKIKIENGRIKIL